MHLCFSLRIRKLLLLRFTHNSQHFYYSQSFFYIASPSSCNPTGPWLSAQVLSYNKSCSAFSYPIPNNQGKKNSTTCNRSFFIYVIPLILRHTPYIPASLTCSSLHSQHTQVFLDDTCHKSCIKLMVAKTGEATFFS